MSLTRPRGSGSGRWGRLLLTLLLAGALLLAVVPTALAADIVTTGSAPAAAPPAPATPPSPADGSGSAAAAPISRVPDGSTPDAHAAQAPEDTSGANEYTEPGVPGGGAPQKKPGNPKPKAVPSPSSSNPVTSSQGAGTQSAQQPAEPTTVTSPPGDPGETLPRTGADAWMLALTGMVLLSSGLALRRLVRMGSPG